MAGIRNTGRRISALEAGQRRHRPDYWLPIISVFLLVVGLIVIFAISPGLAVQRGVSSNYFVSKQLIAILLSIAAFVLLANTPLGFWRRCQLPLLIIAGVAALAVRLFGERVNGAYRWIQIGGLSFQAAELIKFALLIWAASFLVERLQEGTLSNGQRTLKPLLITTAVIGLIVGKIQSDFGSTAVMIGMLAAMAFVIGLPFRRIAMVGGAVLIGLVLLIAPSDYRRTRLATFMHPENDCQNTGYQVCQALIAVGSGGMFGLGLAHSVQAYGYLPEAANDSIFAILAEKFGFVGVTVLLGLFIALCTRLFKIAEQAPDPYSRLIVVGVLAWLSTQAFINIGAMIGLLPLKGITLPFISYGGTSLLFVTGALGLVFQISRYTSFGAINQSVILQGQGSSYENSANRRRNRRSYNPFASRRPGF